MNKFNRIFVIVIDSLGIGAAKDATKYGDAGADTLGHIDATAPHLYLPMLQKLGLGNLCNLKHTSPTINPLGFYSRLNESSFGKDTMTGHWEMMGLHITTPFKTFTETGFPPDLINELSIQTGHKIVGNKSASGTEIIEEYGEHEIATGDMIVYTSADSVMQICGNEETFGLDELYRCCEIARKLTLIDEWRVGRVIARPYVGMHKGEFRRTANRHDYALKPYNKTVLNLLKEAKYDVISVGKINDIFDGEGITESYKSQSSIHGMEQTIELSKKDFHGLCFVNLVDFDALWGHRRDPIGYARELEIFDEKLTELLSHMNNDDLLIITADHGNDPTFKGTDHTREQVPFLVYSPKFKQGKQLEEMNNFAVIGATILENFGLQKDKDMIGESILNKLTYE